jgi:hypothetical protein
MILAHFLTALVIALLLGIVLTAFGWRGPWEAIWVFLLILFLFTWVGGVWSAPYGPPLWGVYWLPFLFFGFLIILLVAAVTPRRRPQTRQEALEQAEVEESTFTAFNLFFWLLLSGLLVALLLRYLL